MKFSGKYLLLLIALLVSVPTIAQQAGVSNLGNFAVRAGVREGTRTRVMDSEVASTLHSISIHYEHNKAWPIWSYNGNTAAYRELVEVVKVLGSKQGGSRTIVIEGAASPIGTESYNNALALKRAKVLKDIIAKMKGGDNLIIHTVSAGEDWKAFEAYVEAKYHAANRKAVLAIFEMKISNVEKERKLYALDRGKTWRILSSRYMDSSRNAAVVRIVETESLATEKLLCGEVPAAELITPLKVEPIISTPQEVERKPVVAIRSNLLVPALNIGVEVPIGTNWSIGADYYFPWIWPKKDNKNCFELLGWGVEGRYWFGRNRTLANRLQGHSLGLYGYMGYYDIERNFHGHQGEFVNVGLDYTYAMAVGKKKAIHFEFSLGVGYIYSQARKYTVIESAGPLISDKITQKIGYFGPTKANISLVVPIFQKVKPNDKEAKR